MIICLISLTIQILKGVIKAEFHPAWHNSPTRCQFHQQYTQRFYLRRSLMRKKDSQVSSVILCFWDCTSVNINCKKLMKLTQGEGNGETSSNSLLGHDQSREPWVTCKACESNLGKTLQYSFLCQYSEKWLTAFNCFSRKWEQVSISSTFYARIFRMEKITKPKRK